MAQLGEHQDRPSNKETRLQVARSLRRRTGNLSPSRSAYQLKLPASFGNIHPVFSVTLLRPFEGDSIAKRQECHPPPPPPIVRDGIEEYEVEKILNSQIFRGKVEYLVCWKGYGVEEDEWCPVRDVQGSKQLVAEFHRTHLQAPRLKDVHQDAAPLKGG